MRKIYVIILLLISYVNLNAQFSMLSKKEFEKLKQTKTYVVLHDSNPDFNATIKKAVEKNWKLTPYEFIQFKDLKQYIDSDKNSFILVGDFGNTTPPTKAYSFYTDGTITKLGIKLVDKEKYEFSGPNVKKVWKKSTSPVYGTTTLSLQLGGAKKYFNAYVNWLVFNGTGSGNINVNSPKLIPMIKLLENTANFYLEGKIKNLKVTSGESYEVYNPNESLASKRLVLLNDEIPYFDSKKKQEFTTDDIKKSFTGNVKIADEKEFSEIIDANDNQNLFLGSYTEGTFSVVFLYDFSGKIYFIEKMNRMSFSKPESKGWFVNALEKFEKAFHK